LENLKGRDYMKDIDGNSKMNNKIDQVGGVDSSG
jgi:hypothetical protein